MSIYHLSLTNISRDRGGGGRKSVIASVAYRSGEKLKDEQTGKIYNYRNRQHDIKHVEITAPSDSPKWVYDRATLWNAVEKKENRKNSRLAKEINVALPRALGLKDNITLSRKFAEFLSSQGNVAVDWAIHNDKENNNPHAHFMIATRTIENDQFTKKIRSHDSKDFLSQVRHKWADLYNAFCAGFGIEKIDHRSFKDRGEHQKLPTVHIGVKKNIKDRVSRKQTKRVAMERRTRDIDYPAIDKGLTRQEYNEQITMRNRRVDQIRRRRKREKLQQRNIERGR